MKHLSLRLLATSYPQHYQLLPPLTPPTPTKLPLLHPTPTNPPSPPPTNLFIPHIPINQPTTFSYSHYHTLPPRPTQNTSPRRTWTNPKPRYRCIVEPSQFLKLTPIHSSLDCRQTAPNLRKTLRPLLAGFPLTMRPRVNPFRIASDPWRTRCRPWNRHLQTLQTREVFSAFFFTLAHFFFTNNHNL